MRPRGAVIAALISLFASLTCAPAYADPILLNVVVTVSFNPPPGSSFDGGTLGGNVQLYIGSGPDLSQLLPLGNSLFFSKVGSGSDPFSLEVEDLEVLDPRPPLPDVGPPVLAMSIDGQVTKLVSSGQEVSFPAFAFPADVTDVLLPSTPPVVLTGTVSSVMTSLNVSGPIFGFASPGTQVGTWQVQVTQVPEPSSVLLLSSGLVGLVLLRRHRS